MGKILANNISDKGIIPRVYKELLEFNNNKINWIKKWAKAMNRHFSKDGIQIASKDMEICSPSLKSEKCTSKPW